MTFCLLFFAAVLTMANSQVPVPCTTPYQWEGRIFLYDDVRRETVRARITYDSIYQRERIIEEYRLNTTQGAVDVIYLHKQNLMYVYNLNTKSCQRKTSDRPWREYGIPKNATSLGESYLGSAAVPNANVLATLWGDTFVDPKGNKVYYRGVWTYEACLPISIVHYSDKGDLNSHVAFFDLSPGIRDPNVFTPRPECL